MLYCLYIFQVGRKAIDLNVFAEAFQNPCFPISQKKCPHFHATVVLWFIFYYFYQDKGISAPFLEAGVAHKNKTKQKTAGQRKSKYNPFKKVF